MKSRRLLSILSMIGILGLLVGAFAPLWLGTGRSSVARRTSPAFGNREHNDRFVNASIDGDLELMERMMASGVSPNAGTADEEGKSALSAAASTGNLAAVKLLLDHGADVNAEDFWGGNALVGASCFGHKEVVEYLLDKGADPNMEDDMVSALDYASHQFADPAASAQHQDYAAIVKMLKAHGARSSFLMRAFGGMTP